MIPSDRKFRGSQNPTFSRSRPLAGCFPEVHHAAQSVAVDILHTGSLPRSHSSGSQRESEPSTGLVALYLLALRASCQDLPSRQRALAYLKNQLSAEKNHTKHHDVPLTNQYQYSLGVLALCVNDVRVDHSVLSALTPHDHHHHSIDTAAMMVLALKCVHESKVPSSGHWMYSHDRRAKAQTAVNKLMEKIQRRQTQSGKIGNIYSTAVALQALLAVGDMERWSKGKGRVLIEARGGAFHNPMALSQLLPVLYQKTYMDIGQMDCNSETDGLRKKQHSDPVITDQGTETNSHQQTALVYLTVKDMNSAVIYTAEVPLHDQMSLLGVLNEAKRNDTSFNFETKQTLWGPFLTSVQHIQAQDNTRTYWRLIRGENTPLIQGIQDYHPQPGEHILLQLSKF
uniref:transcobalamin-2 isoform X3 n=1 Tax=Pristiophorus japonicus TaxID=55135 RepID=UPI00398F4E82